MKIKGKEIDSKKIVALISIVVIIFMIWFFATLSTRAIEKLPSGTIQIVNSEGKNVTVAIKIADTADARRNGFARVSETVVNNNVLFMPYRTPITTSISVNKVKVPLDIAFFRNDGTLIQVIQSRVGDFTYRPEGERYLYVMKAQRGFFQRNNIRPGDNVMLLIDTLKR